MTKCSRIWLPYIADKVILGTWDQKFQQFSKWVKCWKQLPLIEEAYQQTETVHMCLHTLWGLRTLEKKKNLKKRLLGLHCLLPSCINLVHHRVAFGIPLPSTGLQTNGIPKTWLLKSTAKDFSKDFISYFIICNIWNRMVILLKILTPTTYNKIQSNLASSNILQRVTVCIQDWNFQQFLKRLKCLKELFL